MASHTVTENKAKVLEAAISRLPRISLASRPTPLEAMPRLSQELGGPPLYIKRDDLTGLAMGGNKTRMLEFNMAEALEKGAEVVVFSAAVQSNYARQMAAACAKLGLELRLHLRPEKEGDREGAQGNHLLHRLFGAKVTILEDNDITKKPALIAAEVARVEAEGRRPYVPRGDDAIDLDAIAYAEVALEIVKQARDLWIGTLYMTGLSTTQAGLVLGLCFLESPIRVQGICPFSNMPQRFAEMAQIANQAARRLDLDIEMRESDYENDDSFVGERYGIPTAAGIEAIRTVARCEGIFLDPVYTGKGMSGLFAHIREGRLSNDSPVLFLHTGGAPALFAYAEDLVRDQIGV